MIMMIAVVAVLVIAGAAYYVLTNRSGAGQPSIVASFYPYQFFTARIAGDRHTVGVAIPPGVEPHDWEPTPNGAATMASARAFVYNGYVEGFLANFFRDLPPDRPVRVNASAGIDVIRGGDGGPGAVDPHLWLDPVRVQASALNIAAGLTLADPAGNATFTMNAAKLRQDLATLDAEFAAGLTTCGLRVIVTQHEAFAYLAARYNLTQYAIQGLSPDQEPSPAKIQEILQIVNQTRTKYIFYEELVSPAVARALADEAHVQTMVLSPIEGLSLEEQQRGDDYFSLMRMNLANLRTALECT